jgi:hypothetical protein
MPNWLSIVDCPLFVSHRRLCQYKRFPRAVGRWALDSGAFTEIQKFGEWRTTPEEFAEKALLYADEIGNLDWIAPQDWMCEPFMLERTGLTVVEHQRRTVYSLINLRHLLGGSLRVIPVLQGWEQDDYLRHWEMYEKWGFDLAGEPVIGVGSVCRRQASTEARLIFKHLQPLKLHGFGVKLAGLAQLRSLLVSCDSMAWSFAARMERPLPGHAHKNCANCLIYALLWRSRVVKVMEGNNV